MIALIPKPQHTKDMVIKDMHFVPQDATSMFCRLGELEFRTRYYSSSRLDIAHVQHYNYRY
jgi:hypothetical protein